MVTKAVADSALDGPLAGDDAYDGTQKSPHGLRIAARADSLDSEA